MAKVTITIEDEDGGSVRIKMICDPPIDMKCETNNTAAHGVAVSMLEAAQQGRFTSPTPADEQVKP